jgi:hypothetical protein
MRRDLTDESAPSKRIDRNPISPATWRAGLRRRRTGAWLGLASLLVIDVSIAIPLIAFGDNLLDWLGEHSLSSGELFALIVLGVALASVPVGTWWLYRSIRAPAALPGVRLDVEGHCAKRGETISATISLDHPAPENVQLGLRCLEDAARSFVLTTPEGGVSEGRAVKQTARYERWISAPRATSRARTGRGPTRSVTCSFEIPPGCPFSYAGTNVTFSWQVIARRRRRWRRDRVLAVPLWVLP